MAATVRLAAWTGAPAVSNDASTLNFNRDPDAINTVGVAVPRPSGDNTHYSIPKILSLEVTVTDPATTIARRTISINQSCGNGRMLWYRVDGDVYNRPLTWPPDDGSDNDAEPDGYDEILTDPQVYDNDLVPTQSLGRNGAYVAVVCGVSSLLPAASVGNHVNLPTIKVTYDEF